MTNPSCPIKVEAKDFFDYMATDAALEQAEYVNALLQARWAEAVAAAPVVVCSNGGDESKAPRIWWVRALWESIYRKPHTHSARLFCIERLEGEE